MSTSSVKSASEVHTRAQRRAPRYRSSSITPDLADQLPMQSVRSIPRSHHLYHSSQAFIAARGRTRSDAAKPRTSPSGARPSTASSDGSLSNHGRGRRSSGRSELGRSRYSRLGKAPKTYREARLERLPPSLSLGGFLRQAHCWPKFPVLARDVVNLIPPIIGGPHQVQSRTDIHTLLPYSGVHPASVEET